MLKRTPLFETHLEMGGKLIDFGGWELPVQYTGIIEEHLKVRKDAGLFDVSHMGEISIKGPDAAKFIQKLIANDISKAKDRQIVYSPMCYPDGGVVDDLLVYKYSDENYLLIVNASNSDKDYEWIRKNLEGNTEAENISDSYAQLAIQGPKAEEILQKLTDVKLREIKFFRFTPEAMICGRKSMVSRTGYTGEDGFEIYTSPQNILLIWNELLEAGRDAGLVPAGLGARDTLRFEAGLPLYGNELTGEISPLEAGLLKFVKLEKEDFIGKAALKKQAEEGLKRKLVGFEMVGRGIARCHYPVRSNGKDIGVVTSGSYCPSLKKNLGMAIVEEEYSHIGSELDILIRDKAVKAITVKLPFYTKNV